MRDAIRPEAQYSVFGGEEEDISFLWNDKIEMNAAIFILHKDKDWEKNLKKRAMGRRKMRYSTVNSQLVQIQRDTSG